jgi:hypothetical protein
MPSTSVFLEEAMKATVGRIVHYVSYGTPGGEFASQCRAAIVAGETSVDGWTQLCVLNPSGLFFNNCEQDEDKKAGGTWHWPERTED